ncbi:MAG TPA: hypothetical protein VM529_05175, partial [Gemmata sp.]|nr:hypothetical protein [Gemmata sp.]
MSHDSSLEPALRAVEPAARLVPARHLRQVINSLLDNDRRVPTNTDLPHWVTRDELVAADALPSHVLAGTEPRLLLVTDPDDRMIEHLPRGEQLRAYWRVLFRAAVVAEYDRRPAAAAATLDRFGAAIAREVEYVFRTEHLAHPDQPAAATYRMFAAVYLDLATFEPA